MAQLCIDVGGISTTVEIPQRGLYEYLAHRYSEFLGSGTTSGCKVSLELISKPLERGHRVPTVTMNSGMLEISRHDTFARSVDGGKTWDVRIISNEFAFDSFLRVLLTLRLVQEEGFLIHASAQVRNGKGCIFTGKSEAGKTTISNLGSDNLVLCDELPMVRKVNGTYEVFGTPFWGQFGKGTVTDSSPTNALFFLNKAAYNRATELSPARAFPRLLQTTLFFSTDRDLINRLMSIVIDFLATVPSHDLYFLPEPGVWEAVDAALA
jgi:hypothetical protein